MEKDKKEKIVSIQKIKQESEEKYGSNHFRNKILVNLITFIRSLGTIAIVPIFLNCGSFAAALAVGGFFATDFIDGKLARKLHVESFFGSLLDGLSDKAFGIVCLLLLSTLNPIFLAVIAAEVGILAINYKSIERGNNAKSSLAGKAKTCFLAASIVGSFFCYSAPTLKEVLNYVNINSLNTILEQNPDLLSTILAIPTIGASLYVAKDYINKAEKQDKAREDSIENETKGLSDSTAEEKTSLDDFSQKRQELLCQKENIRKAQELKSRDEIIHDLFDTDFYMKHKDDSIKKLLFKQRQ